MDLSKAQKIALAAAAATPSVRRRGVDKAKLAKQQSETDISSTQEWPIELPMDHDSNDVDYEDEGDGATTTLDEEEEFNAHAEELFMDKLDRWFAEYGPKLYDLGLSKHLSKMEKKKSKEESSETSRRSAKKRKS